MHFSVSSWVVFKFKWPELAQIRSITIPGKLKPTQLLLCNNSKHCSLASAFLMHDWAEITFLTCFLGSAVSLRCYNTQCDDNNNNKNNK